jgi:hypothetical protein
MMTSYKTDQMERVFTKLQIQEKSSNHHRSGFIVDESGRKLFPPIFFSKGNKDMGPNICRKLRNALFLDATSFDTLMRCHMSRAEYLQTRARQASS